jgi:sarcosine oxidase
MTHYSAIVLGVGGMGSATLYELANRGHRVLGLEQFEPGHAQGSSHGQTRIIRQAYYEHPDYVPLVQRAYERWFALEQLTGRHLLTSCPCLNIGPLQSELVDGVKLSARLHNLPVEELTGHDIVKYFPAFRFDESFHGILEQRSGYLSVEECVKAYTDCALSLGAELRTQETVVGWRAVPEGVEVQTTKETYQADKLVITAGAWANSLLLQLGLALKVMRQVQLWFRPKSPEFFRRDRFPIFIAETAQGYFYGLPMIDPRGAKSAQHFGAPLFDHPNEVNRQLQPTDEQSIRAFFRQHLPDLDQTLSDSAVCMYTVTPDKHFIVDVHPAYPQVVIACGFSGHGFKFASAIGEVLADLVETGRTSLNIDLFKLSRAAIRQ